MRTWLIGLAWTGAAVVALLFWLRPVRSEVNVANQIAPGVYFHEGDLAGKGHCNNGWIVFDDYVLVVDANFPSGAQEIIPKIKAATDRPVRFAFDTHHHGDHAYGNQVWVDQGAVPVANTGVIEEMRRYETGYYGDKPGRWEESATTRPDVRASRLKPPTLLFPRELVFDDGKHRVELKYLGVAHTHGDGWAWLPKEKILFSGDACVNGPYNYVGDGDVGDWIKTLDAAKKLGATKVCPGHGPMGDASLLEDQRQFFIELRSQAQRLVDLKRTPAEAQGEVERVKMAVLQKERIKRYVGDSFAAQLEKAYVELGGKPFPKTSAALRSHRLHARDHQLDLLQLGPPMAWRR